MFSWPRPGQATSPGTTGGRYTARPAILGGRPVPQSPSATCAMEPACSPRTLGEPARWPAVGRVSTRRRWSCPIERASPPISPRASESAGVARSERAPAVGGPQSSRERHPFCPQGPWGYLIRILATCAVYRRSLDDANVSEVPVPPASQA